LNDLAERTGVALVLVHHSGKAKVGSDPFDAIAGSFGIGAAASTRLLYTQIKHGRPDRILKADGRDIEPLEMMVYQDAGRRLRLGATGSAATHWLALYKVALTCPGGFSAKALAEKTGTGERWARYIISELRDTGAIERIGRGEYVVVDPYPEVAAEVERSFRNKTGASTSVSSGIPFTAMSATTSTTATTSV